LDTDKEESELGECKSCGKNIRDMAQTFLLFWQTSKIEVQLILRSSAPSKAERNGDLEPPEAISLDPVLFLVICGWRATDQPENTKRTINGQFATPVCQDAVLRIKWFASKASGF
jgi:hypothetical protein